jgi:hypothetical protein
MAFDQDARQAPSFRALGKGQRRQRRRRECQFGVFCCSMYWRTMLMGAPSQEEAKELGDQSTPFQ